MKKSELVRVIAVLFSVVIVVGLLFFLAFRDV